MISQLRYQPGGAPGASLGQIPPGKGTADPTEINRPDPASLFTGPWRTTQHSPATQVLIIDDDPKARDTIATYLDEQKMCVTVVAGRQAELPQLTTGQPSIVILDLCSGVGHGLDLLREIRRSRDVPVITTGPESSESEVDCVIALELGADDHLIKPVGQAELLARIRAILRRRESMHLRTPRRPERAHIRFAGWQLDQRARRLVDSQGERVTLTKSEYALLSAFLNAPRRPLSREHLLHATKVHEDTFDRSIDVQVLRLRRKLEVDASAPRMIRTERGIGYFLDCSVERDATNGIQMGLHL